MVLGGALGPGFGAGAPRHFAWQAWHNLTSTFVSRGRRGTISHLTSFCVAGVALMVLGGALGPGFGAGAPRVESGATYSQTTYSQTTYIHTYIPTYLPTYIHTYIPTILPSRSFTISFVFLCFPVPAKTIEAHFREKLTCGVIRSFNWLLLFPGRQQWAAASQIQGRQAPQACTHQWSYILHGSRTATYHQR